MSLVRPAKISAGPYRDPKLYSVNDSSENSGLSTQMFGPDKRKATHMSSSYSSGSGEKYFLDCPLEVTQPCSSGISGTSFHQDYLDIQSPEPVDYDEYKMKLKIQELERALLDDNEDDDEDGMFGISHGMEIDDSQEVAC